MAQRTSSAAGTSAYSGQHGGHGSDDEESKYSESTSRQGGRSAAAAAGGGGSDDDPDDDGDARTVATTGLTLATGASSASSRKSLDVNLVPFGSVCQLMQNVLVSKRLQKEKLMIKLWRAVFQPHVSLFPLMRLLLPQLDSARSTYGLRESSLGDAYIQALGLSKTMDQAVRLKSYRAPHRSAPVGSGTGAHTLAGNVSGEFTLVLVDVLRKYVSVGEGQSKLTVRDVNAMLDTLAQERDKGAPARSAVFTRAVTEMSATENMWFCRIILKDLKIGMKHESMLKLFDPDALNIYNACSSLEQVCLQVAQPGRAQAAFSLVDYFLPCKPMLASSPPWDQTVPKMRGNPFFVGDKFVGERLLIHKKGDQIKLFTRKSVEYTNRYSYGVSFAPVVALALPAHDCIVDGEMLTYDTATGQFLKFGSNRTIALAGAAGDDTKQLCYVAFDILKLNDDVLLDKPLHQRRKLLQELVVPQPKRFEVVSQRSDVTSSAGILAALNAAIDAGKEGIIVKDALAPYVLNDRSDYWIKVKPDYIDGLRDDMDLILLGGYYGEGTRRSGGISHFLLGLHEKKLTPDDAARYADRNRLPPRMFTFCKVGSGYTLERLRELRRDLETKWQKYDPARQPPHFMGWKHEKSDMPDVWIDPRDAPCFQIKCYELTECRPNKFSAGYTCRFPRVVQIRDDKDWTDCMTRDEMLKLAEPAKRSNAAAVALESDEVNDLAARAAAFGSSAAAARENARELNELGMNADDERGIKDEQRSEWGAGDSHARTAAAGLADDDALLNLLHKPRGAAASSSAASAAAPAPPPSHTLYEGIDAHMQGDGDDAREVGAQLASGDGALDWRQGDAERAPGSSGAEGFGIGDVPGLSAAEAAAAVMMDAGGRKKRGGKRKAKDSDAKRAATVKNGSVPSLFRPTAVAHLSRLSNLFENKSFCVMSADRPPRGADKAELERTIALHGGSFTQNPLPHTFCILAKTEDTIKVAVQKKAKTIDIIHYQWLLDCVAQNRLLLPFSSRYVLQGTGATMAALAREVDPYGDSYTQDANVDTLEAALAEVAAKQPHPFDAATAAAAPLPGMGPGRSQPGRQLQSSLPSTLQLHLAKPAPANYRSQFLSFSPEAQAALSSPVRAFIGWEVFAYGSQSSTAAKLSLLTLQLLGARMTDTLSVRVTHVLMLPAAAMPSDTNGAGAAAEGTAFTKDALKECIAGVGLLLDENEEGSDAHAADSAASSAKVRHHCKLITPEWVERQRRVQTNSLTQRAAPAAPLF